MENVSTTADPVLPDAFPTSVAEPADASAAEVQAAIEQPSNVVQLPAAPEQAPVPIEHQIKAAEQKLAELEALQARTAVSELECSPEALALIAKKRAEERYPRAWKEVQKHLKLIAWSGERVAYLEPTSPIFNNKLIKDLTAEGFKCKLISLGANQGHKIEVTF